MAETETTTTACDAGADRSLPGCDEPDPASLDRLCASLEHLNACYRKFVENSRAPDSEAGTAPPRPRPPAPPRAASIEISRCPPPAKVLPGKLRDRFSSKAPRAL